LCAYLLKTRGDERTVPLLEKLGAVVDFYENPGVARLVSLVTSHSQQPRRHSAGCPSSVWVVR